MTWNVAGRVNRATIDGQREYIESVAPDVVALQEVSKKQVESFANLLSWSRNSFEIADERPSWPTAKHDLGCLIAGADHVAPVVPASRLPSLYEGPFPAPERTLLTAVASPLGEIVVASLYQVTGDARSAGWGPLAKRETFRQWAAWLRHGLRQRSLGSMPTRPGSTTRTSAGTSTGTIARSARRTSGCFTTPPEHLIACATRTDCSSTGSQGLLAELRRRRPSGPLAVSHVNRSRVVAERRYDFVYLTPDLVPERAEYLTEVSEPSDRGRRLSDHAPVVAEIVPRLGSCDVRERGEQRTPESWTRSYALLRPQYERYARSLEELMKQLLDVARIIVRERGLAREVSPELRGQAPTQARSLRQSAVRDARYGRSADRRPLQERRRAGPRTDRARAVCRPCADAASDRSRASRSVRIQLVHLVVGVDADRMQFPEWVGYEGLWAEIQVRTILQHAWAAIDHRLRYKRDEEWSPDVKRANSLIAAQLESADEAFERLRQEVLATEPVRPPGQTAALLDEFEVGRMLDDTGIKDRWWARALESGFESGFVADEPLQSDSAPTLAGWSLRWLRLVASIAGISTVAALRETLDRIGDDDARATLERVATGARALDNDPGEVQIDPYDPVSIVLHVQQRISPKTLVDVATIGWRDHEVGGFIQGWLRGMVVESIESILDRQ